MRGTAAEAPGLKPAAPPVQEAKIAYSTLLSHGGAGLQIVRHPSAAAFGRGAVTSLPTFDPASSENWQVDVRGSDLSQLDLSSRLKDLLYADFDSVTKWPKRLPRGFDQALLVDHVEYKDRLRMYEEIHWLEGSPAQMHAPAVASIAVGKTVGVAPEADLYFIANWMGITTTTGEFRYELSTMAACIDRIVTVNTSLPPGNRIRVISISLGINPSMTGYELVKASIQKALQDGIYVVYVGSDPYMGMGREATRNPDDFGAYGPGGFWRSDPASGAGIVMVPMDNRCTASPTGESDYAYYSQGGMSWTVPYVAGLYALACQERPDTTPPVFWDAAAKTARTAGFGKLVDPAKLLEALAK
jgi:hypothetical protein